MRVLCVRKFCVVLWACLHVGVCPSFLRVTSDVVGHLVDCCSQQTLAIVLVLGSIYCSMYDIVLMNMVFYCACGHFQCCVVVTLLCDFMIFWGGHCNECTVDDNRTQSILLITGMCEVLHCDGDDGDDDLGDLEGMAPTPKRQKLTSSRGLLAF